jgi:hypothetical protein
MSDERPEAVAWFKTADRQPEPGNKFVALYDDGSGAWLGFAHDGGVIDSDGDDYAKMPNAEWWAYLPSGFRLSCEDHPGDDWAFTLPDYVCPPLANPQHPATTSDDLVERLRECAEYLKPGETPAQRMARDHKDILALMKLLQREKERVETLKTALHDAVSHNTENARLRDKYAHELATRRPEAAARIYALERQVGMFSVALNTISRGRCDPVHVAAQALATQADGDQP